MHKPLTQGRESVHKYIQSEKKICLKVGIHSKGESLHKYIQLEMRKYG